MTQFMIRTGSWAELQNDAKLIREQVFIQEQQIAVEDEWDAEDAIAPIATVGFTYDFNDRWFAVGSVSYAQLSGEAKITVKDEKLGELINAKTDIEINPILGYAGVGYRF